MMDHPNPKIGQVLTFHAHLEPLPSRVKYRFTFGDGHTTGWLTDSMAPHTYKKTGNYKVQAVAQTGDTTVKSEMVTVTIPGLAPGMVTALSVGVLGLCLGAYRYHGRRLFHRWIREVPKMDLGSQHLSFAGPGSNRTVSVRIINDIGKQAVLYTAKPSRGIEN
jgi:hypothetical protein